MLRDLKSDDRPFIGRRAIEREMTEKTSRWRLTGLVVDWADYDRVYDQAGLIPPKDHTPIHEEYFVYDEAGAQVGYATSYMYSPMLQRHIALARVRPELASPRDTGQVRDRCEPSIRVRRGQDGPPTAVQPTTKDGLT